MLPSPLLSPALEGSGGRRWRLLPNGRTIFYLTCPFLAPLRGGDVADWGHSFKVFSLLLASLPVQGVVCGKIIKQKETEKPCLSNRIWWI